MVMPTASSNRVLAKGILIDFNYDVEPLPGKYPLTGHWPLLIVARIGDEPLGQNDVPLDVLEHLAQRQRNAHYGPDVYGRQVELTGEVSHE